jgi:hypothetical protein
LAFSGRFSVMVAMGPALARRTTSSDIVLLYL